jgi:hypothetical protein
MKTQITIYENYKVEYHTFCSQYHAYKYDAAEKSGIKFSHRFYFSYSSEKNANCKVGGRNIRFAAAEKPACGWGSSNYYQSHETIQRDGKELLILSLDMGEFYAMDMSLDYFNLEPIEL